MDKLRTVINHILVILSERLVCHNVFVWGYEQLAREAIVGAQNCTWFHNAYDLNNTFEE